jgi:V/A-type H+-transporting ATPase subunit I
MSIVPLIKVTLYGPAAEKDAVLDGLQRLGCVHLNDLRRDGGEAVGGTVASDARAALQYLDDSPVQRRAVSHAAEFDFAAVVKQALEIRDRSRASNEEHDQIRKRIAEAEPWGDFELPAWAQDGPLRFWFYAVPHHKMVQVQALELPWTIVARDHRFAYLVVVAGEEPAGLPVSPVALDPRPLSVLRARLQQLERELEELDYRRIGLTLYRQLLNDALDEADDRAARARAALAAIERDELFAVQGWAPVARTAALRQFAADHHVAVTIEAPAPGDTPPTLLDNPPVLRGGEGLVQFYKTPGYSTWDPSKAVFLGFVIFFAMIFSDAGYGLVLGIILLMMWKRLSGPARGLLGALAIASIVYGMLVGAYFGWIPPAGSWLSAVHVLHAEDQTLLMLISIAIGVVHIGGANLVAAWQRRHSLMVLSSIGWACMIFGGFCAGIGKSYPSVALLFTAGLWGLGLGALLVLLFSSEHAFSVTPKLLLSRLVDGLKDLTELSKAFGDVLSYLRLFALGLAAIKLAEVFNHLASGVFSSGGIGILFGLLILLVGHTINFAMGIMSGVVHGLRLNVIEFFNWSLRDEGEQFRAFAKSAQR